MRLPPFEEVLKINVPQNNLTYTLYAWDDYVKVHTVRQVYVKKQSLGYYENSLNNRDFIRCHRSFMVNVAHINALKKGNQELRLTNGFHLPVSRNGYARLKTVLGL
jgi:two-component system LytT family response regulator